MLKLEIGKKYITRDGNIATIINDSSSDTCGSRPFLGKIRSKDGKSHIGLSYYTEQGNARVVEESNFDLISEHEVH